MSSIENNPYIVEDRRMISRVSANRIKITDIIEPGKRTSGIFTCCNAPVSFPICACMCPFCDYPQYIVNEMNASRYVYVRENSIEWNNPTIRPNKGYCCGLSCVDLSVKDNVSVLYFDNIHFDNVRNDTRCCHSTRTACCGGRGEPIRIESSFCCGLCRRGKDGLCFEPSCCPPFLQCMERDELYVEDAERATEVIRNARDNAKRRLKL